MQVPYALWSGGHSYATPLDALSPMDEQYLDLDFQFGGVDQVRKHIIYLRRHLSLNLDDDGAIHLCSGRYSLSQSSTFRALATRSVLTS